MRNIRKQKFWWTEKIEKLRKICIASRKKMQRCKNSEQRAILTKAYKETKQNLKSAIKIAKNSCWKKAYKEIDSNSSNQPYKIIRQFATLKYDIQDTEKEKLIETVHELFSQKRSSIWVEEKNFKENELYTVNVERDVRYAK